MAVWSPAKADGEAFRFTLTTHAPIAQLVEQWPFKPLVGSSSLPGRTNNSISPNGLKVGYAPTRARCGFESRKGVLIIPA